MQDLSTNAEDHARSRVLTALTAGFVTCLLVADITGSKFFRLELFTIGGYEFVTHSVGMLSFPVTFLLTDLINEYFGAKAARRTTYLGLACALLAFGLIFLARQLPVAPQSPLPQPVFEQVFAMSNRLYVASLTAYLIGQLCDIALFGLFKRLTNGKLVWLRATGSTVVSQLFDSLAVTFILFAGVSAADGKAPPTSALLEIAFTGYILKFVLALLLTPLIYAGRWLIAARFGLTPAAV
ncbi:MAG: VUT family protein [Myxococcales bacterium]|nr:VUT family protein [Myxococcales bacterium]